MPTMDKKIADDFRVRMILYGFAKTGKTTWALRAAEAGYNVILCDLDDGYQVAQRLSPEAQKRVYHVDMRRPFGDILNSGAMTLGPAVGGKGIVYDETERRYLSIFGPFEEDHDYCVFNLAVRDLNTVLIMDSWTAFVEQLYHEKIFGNNPTETDKTEWDDYRIVQDVANIFLANLRALGIHVIVVAHAEEYARRKPDADKKAVGKDAIEGIYIQPVSVSRPHGRTLSGKFSDVLFFERPYSSKVVMTSSGSNNQEGGSRLLAPGNYDPEEFSCADYLEQASGVKVDPVDAYESKALMSITKEQLDEQAARIKDAKKPQLGQRAGTAGGTVSTKSAFGGKS